jgi:tRNA(Ile)-lysidine synthase
LLEQFKIKFHQQFHQLLPKHYKFIVAVSGGVDSIVLLDLLNEMKIPFSIAHCNFQLRGEESLRDENVVKSLAEKYNCNIAIQKFDTETYAQQNKISIQVAARNLRYDWFAALQKNEQLPTYILTAHHLNDNIETVFINFCRGTGIDGLTGIDSFDKERKIIRPLLQFKKQDLIEYAAVKGLQYVEDSTNALNKYTRNSFRNQIIPLIQEQFPNIEDNIKTNIQRLNETALIYHEAIGIIKKSLIKKVGEEFQIPILKLKKTQPLNTVIWEICKEFNFTSHQIAEIIKLLDASNGASINSSTHQILNNRNWLIISKITEKHNTHFLIQENSTKIEFEEGQIIIEKIDNQNNFKISTEPNTITIDANNISYPLLLRKWKIGDYFYPLGMTKKQKLSRFFINQKLSNSQKEKVWVIESNKKIVWIVGHRIDNRFKIESSTKNILKISYEK